MEKMLTEKVYGGLYFFKHYKMIKVSFISGINYPEFAAKGDIDFTLSDFVLKDKQYAEHYRKSRKYKITDNMAAEKGVSSSIDSVFKACNLVKTNEVWASDKLYDMKETIKLTTEFIKKSKTIENTGFVIVGLPQGKTMKEWLECYMWMLNNNDIHVIGISKYSVDTFSEITGTKDFAICRIKCIEYLYSNNLVRKALHLAGANHLICHEIENLKKYSKVRSIDSNIAFKLGVHKIKIDQCTEEPKERLNHHIKNLNDEQLKIISYNINKIKSFL